MPSSKIAQVWFTYFFANFARFLIIFIIKFKKKSYYIKKNLKAIFAIFENKDNTAKKSTYLVFFKYLGKPDLIS